MQMSSHFITPDIDWEAKPEPWRSIGLRFRRDCRAIASGHRPVSQLKFAIDRFDVEYLPQHYVKRDATVD